MKYQNFVLEQLKKVTKIALKFYGQVDSTIKPEDNNQVLTQADIEIGKILVDSVSKKYPNHNIIDEEAGVIDNGSEYTWVIDPVDGTSNFASGQPGYGIMIGLLNDYQPIAGGVALPAYQEVFYAEKGLGSWLGKKQLFVTKETDLLKVLLAYGIDGHQEDPQITYSECKLLAEIILDVRNLRSVNSIYDSIQVAAKGVYGGEINRTSKVWDNVARQIIIEEAGGIYTAFNGQPIDYSKALTEPDANFEYCNGAPELYKQLQIIIHKNI